MWLYTWLPELLISSPWWKNKPHLTESHRGEILKSTRVLKQGENIFLITKIKTLFADIINIITLWFLINIFEVKLEKRNKNKQLEQEIVQNPIYWLLEYKIIFPNYF